MSLTTNQESPVWGSVFSSHGLMLPKSFSEIMAPIVPKSKKLIPYGLYTGIIRETGKALGTPESVVREVISSPWGIVKEKRGSSFTGVSIGDRDKVLNIGLIRVIGDRAPLLTPFSHTDNVDVIVLHDSVHSLSATRKTSKKPTQVTILGRFRFSSKEAFMDNSHRHNITFHQVRFTSINRSDFQMILRAKCTESPANWLCRIATLLNPSVPTALIQGTPGEEQLVDWSIVQGSQRASRAAPDTNPSEQWL